MKHALILWWESNFPKTSSLLNCKQSKWWESWPRMAWIINWEKLVTAQGPLTEPSSKPVTASEVKLVLFYFYGCSSSRMFLEQHVMGKRLHPHRNDGVHQVLLYPSLSVVPVCFVFSRGDPVSSYTKIHFWICIWNPPAADINQDAKIVRMAQMLVGNKSIIIISKSPFLH